MADLRTEFGNVTFFKGDPNQPLTVDGGPCVILTCSMVNLCRGIKGKNLTRKGFLNKGMFEKLRDRNGLRMPESMFNNMIPVCFRHFHPDEVKFYLENGFFGTDLFSNRYFTAATTEAPVKLCMEALFFKALSIFALKKEMRSSSVLDFYSLPPKTVCYKGRVLTPQFQQEELPAGVAALPETQSLSLPPLVNTASLSLLPPSVTPLSHSLPLLAAGQDLSSPVPIDNHISPPLSFCDDEETETFSFPEAETLSPVASTSEAVSRKRKLSTSPLGPLVKKVCRSAKEFKQNIAKFIEEQVQNFKLSFPFSLELFTQILKIELAKEAGPIFLANWCA